MFKIVNATGGYGKTTIIRNVSLEVKSGEVVALLGRNGVGKSTVFALRFRVLVRMKTNPIDSIRIYHTGKSPTFFFKVINRGGSRNYITGYIASRLVHALFDQNNLLPGSATSQDYTSQQEKSKKKFHLTELQTHWISFPGSTLQ